MAIQLLLAAEPEVNTTPEETVEYLLEFIVFLNEFFHQVEQSMDEVDEQTGNPLFESEQISYLTEVVEEIDENQHFNQLYELVENMDPSMAHAHGLYGSQFRWKISNINFSFTRYIEQRSAVFFERLLSSIDALLDSVLGAVPGGSAIKELKEAIRNSIALVTE